MLFNVPGSDRRKVEKATKELAQLDALVLDLEDGVAPSSKNDARSLIVETLQAMKEAEDLQQEKAYGFTSHRRMERLIRINSPSMESGSLFERDLVDCLSHVITAVDAIVLPKVESPEEIVRLSAFLDDLEKTSNSMPNRVRILAAIESARGVCNLPSIICSDAWQNGYPLQPLPQSPHPRLDALIVKHSLSSCSLVVILFVLIFDGWSFLVCIGGPLCRYGYYSIGFERGVALHAFSGSDVCQSLSVTGYRSGLHEV